MDLNNTYNRRAFLKWKRKNVTLRSMQQVGQENGGSAALGKGLYTAFLSNKSMAKGYGQVYFAVNAIPKNSKKFNTFNPWELYLQNLMIKLGYVKGGGFPDTQRFYSETSIENEMMKLGYDGVMIIGREMVNYKPENVMYFQNENQLIDYYKRNILQIESFRKKIYNLLRESLSIKRDVEYLANKLGEELNVNVFMYAVPYYDSMDKTGDPTKYSIKLSSIKVPKEKQNQGLGTMAMKRIIAFAEDHNMKVFLTPDTSWGSSKGRLVQFYRKLGFVPNKGRNKDWSFRESMVYVPNRYN